MFSDGTNKDVLLEPNFKPRYTDEYTMEELDLELTTEAISNELAYFCDRVWEITSEAEAKQRPNAVITGGRWILCNKVDNDAPKLRASYVATEVNNGTTTDYYAATPTRSPAAAVLSLLSKNKDRLVFHTSSRWWI